jgi:hypothetical protein
MRMIKYCLLMLLVSIGMSLSMINVNAATAKNVTIPVKMATNDGKAHDVTIQSSNAPLPSTTTLSVQDGSSASFVVTLTKAGEYTYTIVSDFKDQMGITLTATDNSSGGLDVTTVAYTNDKKKMGVTVFPTSESTNNIPVAETTTENGSNVPTPASTSNDPGTKTTTENEDEGSTSNYNTPNDPTTTEKASEPTTTEKASGSTTTANSNNTSPDGNENIITQAVKTGDYTLIAPYVLGLLSGLVVIVILLRRHLKEKKHS